MYVEKGCVTIIRRPADKNISSAAYALPGAALLMFLSVWRSPVRSPNSGGRRTCDLAPADPIALTAEIAFVRHLADIGGGD